jgi:hypothetical protein
VLELKKLIALQKYIEKQKPRSSLERNVLIATINLLNGS